MKQYSIVDYAIVGSSPEESAFYVESWNDMIDAMMDVFFLIIIWSVAGSFWNLQI